VLKLLPHVLVAIIAGGVAYALTRSRTIALTWAAVAFVAMIVLGLAI
jgi:hypothetical protein